MGGGARGCVGGRMKGVTRGMKYANGSERDLSKRVWGCHDMRTGENTLRWLMKGRKEGWRKEGEGRKEGYRMMHGV